ncbi:hypothetical protein GQ43DRAFT_250270 [Delitschia confertaspora ATCC 74209]|uniref:Uncharacterized protein n=1 Tax=Delitschia confertaspora ATCC 74209 TaxID=1513339 RepID=A0A9P4JCF4_9PLEO|nr:hypothetical protein GQ43DRAFT_250270 [Delitschia confertaspora ATCC 74209]
MVSDNVAEWLRRLTRMYSYHLSISNFFGSTGSSPVVVVNLFCLIWRGAVWLKLFCCKGKPGLFLVQRR